MSEGVRERDEEGREERKKEHETKRNCSIEISRDREFPFFENRVKFGIIVTRSNCERFFRLHTVSRLLKQLSPENYR